MDWLSEKYPNTFDKYYRPVYEHWAKLEKEGKRYYSEMLPQLCQTCQVPMLFTEHEKGEPTQIMHRHTMFNNERFHFCSDYCKEIFEDEPEKYSQSWLPVHQIFQGNCGGATLPEVIDWYKIKWGVENLDYVGSEDEKTWKSWHGKE
jgi:phenol hydroxylase P3 protein